MPILLDGSLRGGAEPLYHAHFLTAGVVVVVCDVALEISVLVRITVGVISACLDVTAAATRTGLVGTS